MRFSTEQRGLRTLITKKFCIYAVLLCAVILVAGCRWQRNDFLTPAERAWINTNYKDVVVALDPRWNPDSLVKQQQIYKGLISDFLAQVERKLGVRFLRYYAHSWEQILEAEKLGEIDIHPVLVPSKGRSKDWLFTDPYVSIPMIVVMRASLKDSFSPELMSTLRMGVGQGYGIRSFVSENCKDYNIVDVESDRFGLIKTAMGEVDLMITDLASASYYIESEGLTNLRLAATMGSLYEFSFATRRDKPMLNVILNKALKQISREERRAIYDRWIVFDVKPFYKNRSFWYSAGFALLAVVGILVVIVAWNISLKVEVKLKTAQLQKAHDFLEQRVDERTEQLAEANAALQNEITERIEMTHDILEISSRERARIGRELHDSIGQELVGITFLARAVCDTLQEEGNANAERVDCIVDHVEGVIVGMKRIVRGLLPVDIMDKGLVVALGHLAREAEALYSVKCNFVCEHEDACKISNIASAINLYRIAQEAVSNAAKHAKAETITILLNVADDGAGVLTVEDDGIGIARKEDGHAGMGLKIMRYRAQLAHGGLSISSAPGNGTAVTCRFGPDAEFGDDDVV